MNNTTRKWLTGRSAIYLGLFAAATAIFALVTTGIYGCKIDIAAQTFDCTE